MLYLEILEEDLVETLNYYDTIQNQMIFMQDGASSHTARVVKKGFNDKGIKVLDWPPYLPDLNPIENLWAH